MSEGKPDEQIISDAEIVEEVKNEAENLATDFNTAELFDNQKVEIGGEISKEDKERVDAISGSLKEELEAFKAEDTGEKIEDVPVLSPLPEATKESKNKKDKKKFWDRVLGVSDNTIGLALASGVSIFKKVGNFYQKIKSFFTGKPTPQNKK